MNTPAFRRPVARFLVAAILAIAAGASAQDSLRLPGTLGVPRQTDVEQIQDLVAQLRNTLGEVPAEFGRIAFSQFKTDPGDFSPGAVRFLQARAEEEFRETARRTVVSVPELRTLRIVSTDTSFHMSNAASSQEQLVGIAEKLRLDAFVEGSVTRSQGGDIVLAIKLLRSRTGEIVWSRSFVSGPSKKAGEGIFSLAWSASYPLRVLPVNETTIKNAAKGSMLLVSKYAIDVAASENVNDKKWILFSANVGASAFSAMGMDGPDYDLNVYMAKFGVEVLAIFFRKANPELGYWLGTYVGYQEFVPFAFKSHLSTFTVGYRSRLTRHFSVGGGLIGIPFGREMTGTLTKEGTRLRFDPIAYELTTIHFTF